MTFDERNRAAAMHLISGATLDELRVAAADLRALAQGSALADLVDAKIEQLLTERRQGHRAGPGILRE
jgi:hypothetical protein